MKDVISLFVNAVVIHGAGRLNVIGVERGIGKPSSTSCRTCFVHFPLILSEKE